MALAALFTSPLAAQQEPFHRRFEVGVRAGYMPLDLMKDVNSTESFTNFAPPLEIKRTSKTGAKQGTVGPSLVFRFDERWALGIDAMFRKAGYDEQVIVQTQVATGQTPTLRSRDYQRTRAHFWDIPVVVRYTKWQQDGFRPRVTGMAGVSTRFVTNIESFRESVNDKNQLTQTSAPITPANRNVRGATAGLGIEWRDEIGVRLSIEGRYTRWQKDVFNFGPTRTTRNQVEILLGFSF